jgi:hypothetical protein
MTYVRSDQTRCLIFSRTIADSNDVDSVTAEIQSLQIRPQSLYG